MPIDINLLEGWVAEGGIDGDILLRDGPQPYKSRWATIPISFAASWKFDDNTVKADPGSGQCRFNAATKAATTSIYISDETAGGLNISVLMERLVAGESFIVHESGDSSRVALYTLDADATNEGGWRTLSVTFVDEGDGGKFRNGRTLLFDFFGIGSSGVPEAPDDNGRTYFREGTTPSWTSILKGYGDVLQTTLVTGVQALISLDDGQALSSVLTGNYTLTALTASQTAMSAHWFLQHNNNNVTFPASFVFSGGVVPDTSVGTGIILGLFTRDGGTSWVVNYVGDYTL